MPEQAHETCLDLLRAMVGFESINSNITGRPDAELELARHLDAQAKAMGFATQQVPVSGESFLPLITHQVDESAPWLLFESHLDTVSVEGMTVDPLAGKIENGRMYGRGACDTKASGAAMLWALKQYAAEPGGRNNIAILYSTDEEIGKTGVNAFVKKHLQTLPWRPVGVIVGEPTGLRPVVAHNGAVRWSIHTHGVAAHSADPSKGRSAISMMTKVVDAIEGNYIARLDARHELTGKAQCSINRITGGVQDNIIPEHCEIRLDRRTVPGEDGREVLPAVERLLDELRKANPNLDVSQGDPYIDQPMDPSGGEALAAAVQRVLKDVGMPAEPKGAGYGTDASSFNPAAVPGVVLGPGDIAQAHTHDEWIELAQVDLAVKVYLNLMRTTLEDVG